MCRVEEGPIETFVDPKGAVVVVARWLAESLAVDTAESPTWGAKAPTLILYVKKRGRWWDA